MVALREKQETTVIDIVEKLLREALDIGASDIHLESTDNLLRVRYRLDGILYDQESQSVDLMPQIISRIKVLSDIDLAEKRIPQDGKFCIKRDGQHVDLRVSTFPGLWGQKVVIRLLDHSQDLLDLNALGFDAQILECFRNLTHKSSGFFLVSGPTGSGKTTTLYALLSELNSSEKNILTLENPVEYSIDGITQGQIHPEAGFTFESGMRSLLRQDPDIILVGEIRDKQTAQVAIEAALTGHVVLSTIHTNDAPSVIMRLMDMGIEPYLINSALTGVLAQRLVRRICKTCCQAYSPDKYEIDVMESLGMGCEILYKGNGCCECNGRGYKGRIGIFELVDFVDELRSLIVHNPSYALLCKQAYKNGTRSLRSDAFSKLSLGMTTLEEVVRVIS